MTRPRIAVTMGDPAGVGPELCLRLLTQVGVLERCIPIVFGDAGVLERVAAACDLSFAVRTIGASEWARRWQHVVEPAVVDLVQIDAAAIRPGTISGAAGRASYAYLASAIGAALAGQVDAITTGPIHKEALHAAGVPFPGHTEILAAKTGAQRVCMMLTSQEITCSLVTAHVGYAQVPELLSLDRILEVIDLSHEAMQRLRGRQPQLVVCGLNPHAGEQGLFGRREEQRFIQPAVEVARRRGLQVEGPLPPDTAFMPARRRQTDCYVCMYHDQGLIPLKALAFDTAVNVTLGLPIIRTSVDHGTAFDIAWQGRAQVTSLVEASLLASQLSS